MQFKWYNEVDLKASCADWLCTKGSVGVGTLPGNGTLKRETMYQPAPSSPVNWIEFLDAICASKADTLDLTLTAAVNTSSTTGAVSLKRTATCRVDLKEMRQRLEKLSCGTGMTQVPLRLSPSCLM